MALLFMDGFDKYGGVNNNPTYTALLTTSGEWTTSNGTFYIVTGLSATGFAVSFAAAAASLSKTIPNTSRLIGGVRFQTNLVANTGIQFNDGVNVQCSIFFTPSTGTIAIRNNALSGGSNIAVSTATVAANSTHYLEWDITFSNSGSFQLWLDGVSILVGSGDTTTTANNYCNSVQLAMTNSGNWTADDFYLFDTTGSTHNSVLLTSPRIETTFPVADSSVQFSFGAAALGSSILRSVSANSPLANFLILRRYVPVTNCTISALNIIVNVTNGTAQFRGVIYANSGVVPGTLMSSGPDQAGCTAGVPRVLPLTTPQSLTAGTPYWIGFMNDTSLNHNNSDGDALSLKSTSGVAFSSGAPATAPAMSNSGASWSCWGTVTGVPVNYDLINNQPSDYNYSYVTSSTVGHEDLYAFNSFAQPPLNIYAVAVKALAIKSDTGARTISMRLKSGSVDSGGSLTGQALGTSFSWYTSYFNTDPNGGGAWTPAALNAATSGLKIDS